LLDVTGIAVAQRKVRENLSGAAQYGCVGVDARVAGHHAHALWAEQIDERKELLVHERLDRRGIDGAFALRKREHMGAERDKRLSGAGRRRENDVRAEREFEQRLFLCGVERKTLRLTGPRFEASKDLIWLAFGCAKDLFERVAGSHTDEPTAASIDSDLWLTLCSFAPSFCARPRFATVSGCRRCASTRPTRAARASEPRTGGT